MQVVQERLLSADEVGRRLGIDVSTVYRMASDGRLTAIKVGRQWRFPADSIPLWGGESPIDVVTADAVASVAAGLLGAMVVVVDLDGRPLTRVHNPSDRYLATDESTYVDEWGEIARGQDLVPRFCHTALGDEWAAAFIRSGDRLVGLVIVGGIAPSDDPAPDVHVLTKAQRSLVLDSLPRIAAAVAERRTP